MPLRSLAAALAGLGVALLAVLLDACGVVVDLYWNLPTEIPWVPANQCD